MNNLCEKKSDRPSVRPSETYNFQRLTVPPIFTQICSASHNLLGA